MERLKAKLAPYNVTVIHRPGLQNIADFLSRRTAKIKSPKEIRSITEVPTSLDKITLSEIAKETDGDAVLSTVKTCLIRKFNNISRKKELKAYQQVFHEMEVHESGVLTRNDLIVLPTSLQSKAINLAHEGHLGIVMCKRLLRNRCWWPSIDAMITQEITDCAPCQANTDTTHHEPLIPTEMPRRKNGLTAIDFSSQTPTGEYVLVAYDEGKRYPALKLSRTLTSKEVIRICEELFDEMGIPAEVKSDNGPAFISKQFAEFAQRKGFKHRKICPLNPEANGAGERFMKVLNKAIRCAAVEKVPWKNVAGKMLRNYRATPHTATGISPDFFKHKKDCFDKIPTLRSECAADNLEAMAKANDDTYKEKMRLYADMKRHAKTSKFKVEDPVMVKWVRNNKHQPLFDPHPYRITMVKGNMICAARVGHTITRNSRFFKAVSEKCYTHALSLLNTVEKEHEDHSVTYTLKRLPRISTLPTRAIPVLPNPNVVHEVEASTSMSVGINIPVETTGPGPRYSLREEPKKPDFYDSNKKTHAKSAR